MIFYYVYSYIKQYYDCIIGARAGKFLSKDGQAVARMTAQVTEQLSAQGDNEVGNERTRCEHANGHEEPRLLPKVTG